MNVKPNLQAQAPSPARQMSHASILSSPQRELFLASLAEEYLVVGPAFKPDGFAAFSTLSAAGTKANPGSSTEGNANLFHRNV